MKLSSRILLAALFAFGVSACAPPKAPPPPPVKADPKPPPPKKQAKQATPAMTISIGKIVVQRHDSPGPDEHPIVRATLKVHNHKNAPIQLKRVEYSTFIGGQDFGVKEKAWKPPRSLAPNSDSKVVLERRIKFKDNVPMRADRGRIEATIYYIGPGGNARTQSVTLPAPVEVRGR